jgi:glucose/arabinose dehydrogenase
MPAFSETFSDDEIRALARYIREKIPEEYTESKPAFHAQEMIRSQRQRFLIDTVVSGLNVPWGMAFLPNGDMLISERSGTLYRFSKGRLTPRPDCLK